MKLKTTKRVSRSPQIDTGSYATQPAGARPAQSICSFLLNSISLTICTYFYLVEIYEIILIIHS